MAVHRFKAGESDEVSADETAEAPKKATKAVSKKSVKKAAPEATKDKLKKERAHKAPRKNVFRSIGGYLKGSWAELRQVRWPNRKQTWQLTLAVILFSLIVGLLIFVLDALFTWLFKEVIL